MASYRHAAAIALVLLATAGAKAAAADQNPGAAIALETSPQPKVVPAPAPKLTAAERCASLQQQVAVAVLIHMASKKLSSARKLAEDGAEDCAQKKYSLGTRRFVEALAALGVTPRL